MEKELRQLIEKYMEGQTTLQEEAFLAEYFRNNEVGEELLPYKEMFAVIDDDLDRLAKRPKTQVRKTVRPLWIGAVAAAAAAVLLLITFAPEREEPQIAPQIAAVTDTVKPQMPPAPYSLLPTPHPIPPTPHPSQKQIARVEASKPTVIEDEEPQYEHWQLSMYVEEEPEMADRGIDEYYETVRQMQAELASQRYYGSCSALPASDYDLED